MQRILVVDDNEDILDVIALILEDYGYEVITLSDGRLLFEKIDHDKPNLILLDVMLGNADGRELCQVVKSKKETQDIPVILVSASHNLADRVKPQACSDDFLAKPFDIDELLNKVRSHLTTTAA
ncbi:MAG TPA: response regulator [Mucilaginibacter sp.]|nr:response regulator [Mucilaginibacter sp.]